MTTHIFGMALTHEGTFSNNRGENEGNTNTLQKVIRNGDMFSTVSAEAIRYALRDGWQQGDETLNRRTLDHRAVQYTDREFGPITSGQPVWTMTFSVLCTRGTTPSAGGRRWK